MVFIEFTESLTLSEIAGSTFLFAFALACVLRLPEIGLAPALFVLMVSLIMGLFGGSVCGPGRDFDVFQNNLIVGFSSGYFVKLVVCRMYRFVVARKRKKP